MKSEFIPDNMTSRLLPLDQDIIAIVKKNYENLLRDATQGLDSDQPRKPLNVLQAI